MSRPSFLARFWRGHLNRWEHALVGGVTGIVFSLLLFAAVAWISTSHRSPDAMSFPALIMVFGAIFGTIGMVMGAMAEVSPYAFLYQTHPSPEYVVALVWPKERASRRSLQALGRALKAWKRRNPAVKSIEGMGRLLNGYYPRPDSMRPYLDDFVRGEEIPWPAPTPEGVVIEYRKMSVVEPWLHCPALVVADENMTSLEAVKSLLNAIPPELVRFIGFPRG